ncbi:MAG: efflux RND transporter periplasmic adaptor subunit [Oligoflexales bacterium]|nr:efflux RND transporter periplasmic adaptor subunit [Oligoflexales bacterium]
MQLLILYWLSIACDKVIIHPEKGDVVEAVYGLGTVESDEVFHARSALVGSVQTLYVTEGQDVKKGDLLYKTDQDALTRAYFPGRITEVFATVGENLFPQSPILTLVNLERLFLSVSLEQQGTMRIRPGMKAEVSFEFFRNKKITGKISTIYPRQDQFIAKVEILDWPEGVLPGMTADVAFEIARKQNVTLVPSKAIANGHLLIKRSGKKQKIPVEVGLVDLEKAEILSPELSNDDEIILP